jgi:cytochrome c
MKRGVLGAMVAVAVLFGAVCLAYAAAPEDAKGLAEKAAAYAKANGKEKAITDFNNPTGAFVKGELYIFALDFDGKMLANGGNPKMTGNNWKGAKDSKGKLFAVEMIDVAKAKGSGWVEYSWTHPTTKKIQPKVTWVQRVEGADYFVACGIYK